MKNSNDRETYRSKCKNYPNGRHPGKSRVAVWVNVLLKHSLMNYNVQRDGPGPS